MPLTLVPVETEADFLRVTECQWTSYENPLQSFFRMFCPLRGTGEKAREESLKESAERQWREHLEDDKSHWLMVVDEQGNVAGASLWKIYPQNPFEKPSDHGEAYWHPAGEAREYVTKAIELFEAPRKRMGARPHVYLNIIFTHPDYRGRGVANLLLTWGIKRADDMGVEMWLDATAQGVPVYQRYGFIVVNENKVRPVKENPGPDWKAIEAELDPIHLWQMWRPIGGTKWEEGKPKPWE